MNFRYAYSAATVLAVQIIASQAAILYVDVNCINPVPPYSGWITAATTIQDAVDAAAPGDQILVNDGIYQTGGRAIGTGTLINRVAVDKAITVQSVNGPGVTLIKGYQLPGITNGDGAIRCVYLTNNAGLIGFTISNGATRGSNATASERNGGGVSCRSGVIVSNCIIAGNSADFSGGGASLGNFYNCTFVDNTATNGGAVNQSTLSNCMLSANTGYSGGGANFSTLNNCILTDNFAQSGAGAYDSTLVSCILSNNVASSKGGGTYLGKLTNCVLAANSASSGGGLYSSAATGCRLTKNLATSVGGGAYNDNSNRLLRNCALIGNTAVVGGGSYSSDVNTGLYNCTVTGNRGGGIRGGFLRNSLVYYNEGEDLTSPGTVSSSCTPTKTTNGSITNEPGLATSYHLSVTSPCRGAGNAASALGKDIDGESWSNPPSMGCDEFYAGTAIGELNVNIQMDYTNLSPNFGANLTALIDGWATASRWDFGDGTVISNRPYASHAWAATGDYSVVLTAYNDSYPNGITTTTVVHVINEVLYVATNSPGPLAPYDSWATAATNIQDAIDVAKSPKALVLVSNGVYNTGGRVVSGGMTNRVAVTKPIILKSVNGPALTVIEGFQTTNSILGDASIRCVYLTNKAELIGFTLTNGATKDFPPETAGGGAWCGSSVVISNCVISGNAANAGGGVAYGQLINCTLINNIATGSGGGVYNAILNGCTLISNSAPSYGGGAFSSILNGCNLTANTAAQGGGAGQSSLTNCILSGNAATEFGGGSGWFCTLVNCIVAGNFAARWGGGDNSGNLINCTVTGNTAPIAGGVNGSSLKNCIVYYNMATEREPNHSLLPGNMSNCCTMPLPEGGSNNFTNAPLFVNITNDFHLESNSPCINAGNNADVINIIVDLDGRPRTHGGIADVGAYEFQNGVNGAFITWLKQYGLPTDGSADNTDSDGDGLNNWQEWRTSTDPNDALSALKMLSPILNGSEITVKWRSVSGIIYSIQRSTNLSASPAFSSIESNFIGQANTTTYTDIAATNGASYFYRVSVP